ncbi:hypothetical protein FRC08_016894 [Ceratobasidium sp. 394]|nr:hypothetical protein FRC08_016894 [Ceratobasidium sp. 394]
MSNDYPLPGSKMSASVRVFGVPELANIICGFADRQDCARLMRVCHYLFLLGRAFVWNHVTGAIRLLRLMPGKLNTQSRSKKYLTAVIDTSRFDLYAPFVESLEISCRPNGDHRIEGKWRTHLVHAQNTVWLPKLRRLSYTRPGDLEEDQLDYVLLFLSASIQRIKITFGGPYPLWQSLSSASRVLHAVSRRCPRLEHLEISPGEPFLDPDDDFVFSREAFTIHEQMSQLTSLRSLFTSPAIFQPDVFRAISTYPCLETLLVQAPSEAGPVYDNYELSEASFLALRQLELRRIDPHVIKRMCSLEPFVRYLTWISISFADCGGADTWRYDGDAAEILCIIAKLCPQLTQLTFDTGFHATSDIIVSPDLIKTFRGLSLQHLDLTYVETEHIGWDTFLQALPVLEEFYLLSNCLGCIELRPFAIRLPRLRLLVIAEIYFDDIDDSPTSTSFDLQPCPSPIPVCVSSHFQVQRFNGRQLIAAVRYLHNLWPSAVFETHPSKGNKIKVINHMNRILSMLRRSSAS